MANAPEFDPKKPFQTVQEYPSAPEFDPNKPFDVVKQEAPNRSGEAFLKGTAQGVFAGYLPHLQAMAEPLTDKIGELVTGQDVDDPRSYTQRRDANIKELEILQKENPKSFLAGELAGGIGAGLLGGAVIGGGAKAIQGATRLARVGSAAKAGAKAGAVYGALRNPGDVEGEISPLQLPNRGINAAIGAATGGVTGGAIQGGAEGFKLTGKLARALKVKAKPNAKEIEKAAERMGAKATPGMVNDSMAIQGLESSLEQSPTIGGALVRNSTEKVRAGVQNTADDILSEASGKTPYQVGEKVKGDVILKSGEKLSEAQAIYDEVIPLIEKVKINTKPEIGKNGKPLLTEGQKIANSFNKIDEIKAAPSQFGKLVRGFQDDIRNAKTLKDVRIIRQTIGKKMETDPDPAVQKVLGSMYNRLDRYERALIRGNLSKKSGDQAVKLYDKANKIWSDEAKHLKEFGKVAGVNAGSPKTTLTNLGEKRSEALYSRLSNDENQAAINYMREKYPDLFESIKGGYLQELKDSVTVPKSKDFSIPGMVRKLGAIPQDARKAYLGNKADKIADLETVYKSAPDRIGPSGTPQGMEFQDWLNIPGHVASLGKYGAWKYGPQIGNKVADAGAKARLASKYMTEKGLLPGIGGLTNVTTEPYFDESEVPYYKKDEFLQLIESNPELLEKIRDPDIQRGVKKELEQRQIQREPADTTQIDEPKTELEKIQSETSNFIFGRPKFETGRERTPFEAIESYTAAPLREAISQAQKGNFSQAIPKAAERFGKDPRQGTQWPEVVKQAGVENRDLQESLGLLLTLGADPANLIPGKAISPGVAGAVKRVKGADNVVEFPVEKALQRAKDPNVMLRRMTESENVLPLSKETRAALRDERYARQEAKELAELEAKNAAYKGSSAELDDMAEKTKRFIRSKIGATDLDVSVSRATGGFKPTISVKTEGEAGKIVDGLEQSYDKFRARYTHDNYVVDPDLDPRVNLGKVVEIQMPGGSIKMRYNSKRQGFDVIADKANKNVISAKRDFKALGKRPAYEGEGEVLNFDPTKRKIHTQEMNRARVYSPNPKARGEENANLFSDEQFAPIEMPQKPGEFIDARDKFAEMAKRETKNRRGKVYDFETQEQMSKFDIDRLKYFASKEPPKKIEDFGSVDKWLQNNHHLNDEQIAALRRKPELFDDPEFIKLIENGPSDRAILTLNNGGSFVPNPNFNPMANNRIGNPADLGHMFGDSLAWVDSKWKTSKDAMLRAKSTGVPLEINTAQDLIARDDYIQAIPEGSTVNLYVSGLDNNDYLKRRFLPGHASDQRVLQAYDALKAAGINVNLKKLSDVPEIRKQMLDIGPEITDLSKEQLERLFDGKFDFNELAGGIGAVKQDGMGSAYQVAKAKEILDRVKTPEQAVALRGAEREQYLKALDEVYGNQNVRAKEMGYGRKEWLHGSPKEFDQFMSGKELGKESANGNSKEIFFTDAKETAELYGKPKAYRIADETRQIEQPGWSDDISELFDNEYDGRPLEVKLRGMGGEPSNESWLLKTDNKNIRSVDAAFDPRFADSPLLMSGGIGATDSYGLKEAYQFNKLNEWFNPKEKHSEQDAKRKFLQEN